jgi:hypothetical protein
MTNPRPKAGRPTELDAPIDVPTANGGMRRATVEQRIIELMGTGAHVDTAAQSLGIERRTLHEWLKTGARARKDVAAGRRVWPDDPNRDPDMPTVRDHDLRCAKFSLAVDSAQADWLMRQEATLEAAGRPRRRQVVTVKTDAQGQPLETSTRTEDEAPDMATVRWRLERHPASRDTYGRTTTAIELSGPDGEAIPVDVRTSTLADKIAELRAKRTDPQGEPDAEPE